MSPFECFQDLSVLGFIIVYTIIIFIEIVIIFRLLQTHYHDYYYCLCFESVKLDLMELTAMKPVDAVETSASVHIGTGYA